MIPHNDNFSDFKPGVMIATTPNVTIYNNNIHRLLCEIDEIYGAKPSFSSSLNMPNHLSSMYNFRGMSICDPSARNQAYVVFLHVEFELPHCTAQSMLQIGENQKSIFFCNQSYGILKTAKTSNLKEHNNEKWPLKKKNHISTLFKIIFKIAKRVLFTNNLMIQH